MNYIHTYLVVDKDYLTPSFLNEGRFAWLPVKGTDYIVVFNMTSRWWENIRKKHGDPGCFCLSLDNLYHQDLPVSAEAFEEACDAFNRLIENQRKTHARYDALFDRTLQLSLVEGKDGHASWQERCILYGWLVTDRERCAGKLFALTGENP